MLNTLLAAEIIITTNLPAEFSRFIRDEHAHWGKLIREAGIKGE